MNCFPEEKCSIISRKNNLNALFAQISSSYYTYIFINSNIVIIKMFKKYLLNCSLFTDCFYLIAIDKIYFIKKKDKNFV